MNNMRIVEIPASMRENAGRKNTARKLRVAAYCRVSTEEEEQQGSFEIQKLYYTEKINSTPKKSIPPRSGKSRASMQMTEFPAYIPRSVMVSTR